MRNRTIARAFEYFDKFYSEGRGRMHKHFEELIQLHLGKARVAIGVANFEMMAEHHARAMLAMVGYMWSNGDFDKEDLKPLNAGFEVGPTHVDAFFSYMEDILGGENMDSAMNVLLDSESTRTIETREGKTYILEGEKPKFDNLLEKWKKSRR